jgi:hypothetical protein
MIPTGWASRAGCLLGAAGHARMKAPALYKRSSGLNLSNQSLGALQGTSLEECPSQY